MCARVLRVQLDDTDAAPEPIPVVGRNHMPCTIAVVSGGRRQPDDEPERKR